MPDVCQSIKMLKSKGLIRRAVSSLMTLVNNVVPKSKGYLVFISYPDFADSAFTLFEYIREHYSGDRTFIWLVAKGAKKPFFRNSENVVMVVNKKSLRGFYLFCRSKYIFFTHGHYGYVKPPESQIIINLWHGMPLKKIGHYQGNRMPSASLCVCTSQAFVNIMSKSFQLDFDKVLPVGLPRNDLLIERSLDLEDFLYKRLKPTAKVILWMPTFRDPFLDGDGITQTQGGQSKDVVGFLDERELVEFDAFLGSKNASCIIKPHPLEVRLNSSSGNQFVNIVFVSNEALSNRGIQLYSLLSFADALITDYSSVFIDFMLTKKPIAFVMPDYSQYKNTRGFIFENLLGNLPGPVLADRAALMKFVECLAANAAKATYIDNGQLDYFHSRREGFCQALYEEIFPQDI